MDENQANGPQPATPPARSPGLLLTVLGLGIGIGVLATVIVGDFLAHFADAERFFNLGIGIGVGLVVLVSIINFLVNAVDKTRDNL